MKPASFIAASEYVHFLSGFYTHLKWSIPDNLEEIGRFFQQSHYVYDKNDFIANIPRSSNKIFSKKSNTVYKWPRLRLLKISSRPVCLEHGVKAIYKYNIITFSINIEFHYVLLD